MVTRRKHIWISIVQTGVLLIVAGSLLFLYKIPWTWMRESAPLLVYGGKTPGEESWLLEAMYRTQLPLYEYTGCGSMAEISVQSTISVEEILLAEARDEEKQVLFQEAMEQENSALRQELTADSVQETEVAGMEAGKEEQAPLDSETNAQPRTPDLAKYDDFETLLQELYVVDNSTYITEEELNVDKMLKRDLRLWDIRENTQSEGPQVLIYHTHSQEAYADSAAGDESTTVLGAGARLAELLEGYGIRVMHHKGKYDVENRDYAYANAEKEISAILEEYPSIEVVIDLHRDGVADGTRLVTEVDGKPTAQFMFFNGLSRLKSTGEIAYLKNENRAGNLAFSFQLQLKCMEYYPGLARSIYLKGYRYNMQYREKSLLVELGAQTNTVEEVYNALPPLAHVISMVLLGE